MLSPGFAHQLLHALQQITSSNGMLEEIAAFISLACSAVCCAALSPVLGSASSSDNMGYAGEILALGCRIKDMRGKWLSVLSTLWIREHPIKLS